MPDGEIGLVAREVISRITAKFDLADAGSFPAQAKLFIILTRGMPPYLSYVKCRIV